MKEAENRAKDINQSILEERNKITEGGLKNKLQMQHQSNIGDIEKLGMLGDQGQQEFGDSIKNIRDLNRLGSTKWQNSQAENEDLYKNYQNESLWQWPHMRNQIRSAGVQSGRSGALGDVFAGMQDRNISLDNLAALNTNYSNIQRERDTYRDQATGYRGELDSLRKINDAQTQKMAIAKAQEQQRRVAEQNRQNQLRMQQERASETARLQQLQAGKDAFLGRWNQLMNRKAESDVYWNVPVGGFGASQGSYDSSRFGQGANPNIMSITDVNNQKHALAKEAHKFGLNPWKDLPGYN
jgi:hypothetical protein